MKTDYGDIVIALFANESPKACRNFLQLCLEGYYNNTIFHRIVKDFLIQGGDHTGTGNGGSCVYPGKQFFVDEFHSRLKFTNRGLVACANRNRPDTNNSQFFITMDRAEYLNKKNTIFGKVHGATIYNVLRFNELAVDSSDRPFDPP